MRAAHSAVHMNDIAWERTCSIEVEVGILFAWSFMTDVTNWADPPAQFELAGPFATGSEGTTRMPGRDPLRWRIRDVQVGKSYTIDMTFDRATVSSEWRFDAVSDRRTRVTQRIVLSGDNAPAYAGEVEAGFGENLHVGMKKIAAAMAAAEGVGRDGHRHPRS